MMVFHLKMGAYDLRFQKFEGSLEKIQIQLLGPSSNVVDSAEVDFVEFCSFINLVMGRGV